MLTSLPDVLLMRRNIISILHGLKSVSSSSTHNITYYITVYLIALSLIFGVLGCTNAPVSTTCTNDLDCLSGQVCLLDLCRSPPPKPEMSVQVDCFENADCEINERCIEGLCYANECTDGDEQACMTVCGMGSQLCSGGIWRACNAQPTTEVCGTGEDEDCDGQTDEGCSGCMDGESRECMTECGAGVERCLGNVYRGCTAARPRVEVCGDPEEPVDEDCDGTVDEGCADCEDGETRTCDSGCGQGEEICSENTWRNCSAPTPIDEYCDRLDNDCDGDIDEEITRDCSTSCGSGSEQCEMGTWVMCTAPLDCDCVDNLSDTQICGSCGQRERICEGGVWREWEECVESGQCSPGVIEDARCGQCGVKRRICVAECSWGEWQECKNEGVCEPGETEEESCPNQCGVKSRICTDSCQWGEWTECSEGLAECNVGDSQTEDCGQSCGERTRVCGSGCRWGEWTECSSEGICLPTETENRSCGPQCSTESRTCQSDCTWGDWGACSEGGCTVGAPPESRACGQCGTQERVCMDGCIWSDWSFCDEPNDACNPGDEERIVCGENNVGLCVLGESRRVCSDECQWGEFGRCEGAVYPSSEVCGNQEDEDCDGMIERAPDIYESNNSCVTCANIPGVNPDRYTLRATIDSADDDWDYYCFEVEDGFSIFGSNIQVELRDVPVGRDYDLYLYQSVTDCEQGNSLAQSTEGAGEPEELEWGENIGWGADDSGRYVIGVRNFNRSFSCEISYELYVHGLR